MTEPAPVVQFTVPRSLLLLSQGWESPSIGWSPLSLHLFVLFMSNCSRFSLQSPTPLSLLLIDWSDLIDLLKDFLLFCGPDLEFPSGLRWVPFFTSFRNICLSGPPFSLEVTDPCVPQSMSSESHPLPSTSHFCDPISLTPTTSSSTPRLPLLRTSR